MVGCCANLLSLLGLGRRDYKFDLGLGGSALDSLLLHGFYWWRKVVFLILLIIFFLVLHVKHLHLEVQLQAACLLLPSIL